MGKIFNERGENNPIEVFAFCDAFTTYPTQQENTSWLNFPHFISHTTC